MVTADDNFQTLVTESFFFHPNILKYLTNNSDIFMSVKTGFGKSFGEQAYPLSGANKPILCLLSA